MTPERWERVKEQFELLRELGAEARARALLQLHQIDPEVADKVKELLANHDKATEFMPGPLIIRVIPPSLIGETIAGRYRIDRFIGHGGMGEVYEAYDTELDERIALKRIIPHAAMDERFVARLLREVRLARKIANRHVCRVYHADHHDEPWGRIYFFTMELLEGETLAAHLQGSGCMSVAEAFPLIEQMAHALRAAHEENIIHRDLKPGNIVLTGSPGRIRVVVTDFGLARSAESTDSLYLSRVGPPGTRGYIAPELFRPGAAATIASDIYSFGVVIQDMVGRNGSGKNNSRPLPARWESTIGRCLENDPEKRFQSAPEVVDCLRPETGTSRVAEWSRRHPRLAIFFAVLLAASAFTPIIYPWVTKPHVVTELRQITTDFGLSDFPAISHDGKLLVYASDRDGPGNLNLFLQQIDGYENPRRLTYDQADDYAPSFSADNSKVAFRSDRNGGGVYQIPTLGGKVQLIARGGFGPSFSPDGQWIAYWVGLPGSGFLPGSSEVYVKPVNGGPARPVPSDLVATCWPIWAPDSKHLLVTGKPDTKLESAISVDWWIIDLNGGPALKTSVLARLQSQHLMPSQGRDWITPIAWLSNPNRILFSAAQGDTTNLWEVPVSATGKMIGAATRRTHTVTLDLHASAFEERNGASKQIFFSSLTGRVNVWSAPMDGDSGRPAAEMLNLTPGANYAADPSISSSGSEFVFISAQSKIWSVRTRDLATGQETVLTAKDSKTTPGAGWLRPRISPDGSLVAYVDNTDQMYLANKLTGTTQKICNRCGPPTDISNDGQTILFEPLNPPEDVMMIDVPSCRIRSLVHAHRADHILFSGRFSPDSRWVVFTASLDNTPNKKLFISPVHDGRGAGEEGWIPITDGLQVDANATWSPDGNLLYFLSERDGFRCIWAQRLLPANKQPEGPAFPVRHFHHAGESLARVDRFDLIGLSAARNQLVFAVSELKGNVWMEEQRVAYEGIFSRLVSAIYSD